MKYPEMVENQWFEPTMQGFKHMCCDCGLVHQADFRIIDGHVEFRVRRDNRATGQSRRYKQPIVKVKFELEAYKVECVPVWGDLTRCGTVENGGEGEVLIWVPNKFANSFIGKRCEITIKVIGS